MSKILNKVPAIIALAFVLVTTGCLKDSDYDNNWIGTKNTQNQNFVEVHLTTSDNSNLVSRAYAALDHDTTIAKLIPIHLTSGPASSDVTVSVKMLTDTSVYVMDSLVNVMRLLIPDTSSFKLVNSGKVIIPKGSSTGYVGVTFKPADLLGSTYVLGVKITGISDSKYSISSLDTGFVKIIVKNQWDGMYTDKGYFIHPTLGKSVFDYNGDNDVEFATVGSTTVEKPNSGDRAIPADVTITSQTMDVNGATVYKVTVDVPSYPNNYGQTDTDPDGNPMNYYNPVTKTFELYYWYNSANHRIIRETLTYDGPRP